MKRNFSGFTLIELLIVVAIIAILAAIAVPNFLEAQTRAKVSRVKNDFRTYATAIEAYTVDHNKIPRPINTNIYSVDAAAYPGQTVRSILWYGLTTPVAYITTVDVDDVFQSNRTGAALEDRRYTYQDHAAYAVLIPAQAAFWRGSEAFFGKWKLASVGPDKEALHFTGSSFNLPYDPTNGTVSLGNIFRSQRHSDTAMPPVGGTPLILSPH